MPTSASERPLETYSPTRRPGNILAQVYYFPQNCKIETIFFVEFATFRKPNAPTLVALAEKVNSRPQIKQWIEKRPKTKL